MPSKKHPKVRLIVRRRGKDLKLVAVKRSNQKSTKQPPDTSRIPWMSAVSTTRKTGTDT